MLRISTEYRKGVFFVRIIGRNDNGSKIKEVLNIIDELGISNIVFNLKKLDFLSVEQMNYFKISIFFSLFSKKRRIFPHQQRII